MMKSRVYQGNYFLGEVEIQPLNQKMEMSNRELKISHLSQPSERCPPLAVLHIIASSGVCFKMEAAARSEDLPLFSLHSTCLGENKTAVVLLEEEELHLVAMPSRQNLDQNSCSACFWGFIVAPGLYSSCLVMLNLRCLGIVFDLDETLIVANTMRSFEDRIDALQRKINTEVDPQRISGMLAEIKRYQDDRLILKQYVENDQVVENGKVTKVQSELVPALSDSHQQIVRPLIRLQEKNIILTRINPMVRDTSVLVRLRPAWEDLRNYLTARGRKRFEVYVCTMAEKDYALEMWRLLDPESNLINSKELLDRIVCVKAGSRKSLLNVFHDGICHPKMALVIDDRLKVWEEKDQPRVHVVPAFAPYYAPQAEGNNAIPILCVARNVACNVRGGFFKEFDEGLLQRLSDVVYEDNVADLPPSPDVSNYLISEDDASAPNKDPLPFEGMSNAEVEKRLKDAILSSSANNLDPRLALPLHLTVASSPLSVSFSNSQGSIMPFNEKHLAQGSPLGKQFGHLGASEPSLQGSPGREEGEVPESELDPDTRRRLLILQHGQDIRDSIARESSFPARPAVQVPAPLNPPRGNWLPFEEEMSPRQPNRAVPKPSANESPFELEPIRFDKHRHPRGSFFRGAENSFSSGKIFQDNRRFNKEVHRGEERTRVNHSASKYTSYTGNEMPPGPSSSSKRNSPSEPEPSTPSYPETPAGVLQDIATKCGTKVEFRTTLVVSRELQFSIEVWFSGEKISQGIGKTRKEAQLQAAELSLRILADKYLATVSAEDSSGPGDYNKFSQLNDNGSSDLSSFEGQTHMREEPVPVLSTSDSSRFVDSRLEGSKKSIGSVSSLKELCMTEGLALVFQAQPQPQVSTTLVHKGESYAQVEIGGQVLGNGIGSTWDEAKMQAAEEALGNLRSMLGSNAQKYLDSPRSSQAFPNKRLKTDAPRVLHRIPSSTRYSTHASPVP
ncbi:hypothetical protein Scep_011266 [Stephania cephalantha]|uniref:protein-serine/threonine phosphatase n=1 Tax=Stephania cephalantha TaxID=152367 RepID=A0AAP0P5P8_9MAGN